MHHHLSFPLSKSIREVRFVMSRDDIVEPRLTAVLVDTLGDLVASGVAKAREKRQEPLAQGRGRVLAEDDRTDSRESDLMSKLMNTLGHEAYG